MILPVKNCEKKKSERRGSCVGPCRFHTAKSSEVWLCFACCFWFASLWIGLRVSGVDIALMALPFPLRSCQWRHCLEAETVGVHASRHRMPRSYNKHWPTWTRRRQSPSVRRRKEKTYSLRLSIRFRWSTRKARVSTRGWKLSLWTGILLCMTTNVCRILIVPSRSSVISLVE